MQKQFSNIFAIFLIAMTPCGAIAQQDEVFPAVSRAEILVDQIINLVENMAESSDNAEIAKAIEELIKNSNMPLADTVSALSFLANMRDNEQIFQILSLVDVSGEIERYYAALSTNEGEAIRTQSSSVRSTDRIGLGLSAEQTAFINALQTPPPDSSASSDYTLPVDG